MGSNKNYETEAVRRLAAAVDDPLDMAAPCIEDGGASCGGEAVVQMMICGQAKRALCNMDMLMLEFRALDAAVYTSCISQPIQCFIRGSDLIFGATSQVM